MEKSQFWQNMKVKGPKFAIIGTGLAILKLILLQIFQNKGTETELGYAITTVGTYVLQFYLNDRYTWNDRKTNFQGNAIRILKYIPIKALAWKLDQLVFAFWLKALTWTIENFSENAFVYKLGQLDNNYIVQLSSLLVIGTMLPINYLIFDQLIMVMKSKFSQIALERR